MEFRAVTTVRPRRAMIAYLAIIVIPTLVLLGLGLQSVRRQYQAIEALTAHNARLTTERAADALERRVVELARRALRDRDWSAVLALASQPPTPDNERSIRRVLERIAHRHPVASYLVVLEGNTVRFPLTTWPLPDTIDGLLEGEDHRAGASYAALFAEAERAEAGPGDVEDAAAAYRRCAALPVSKRLKAIALARAARCYRSAGKMAAARSAWQEVATGYGDEDDLFHQPYALVAGLELCELTAGTGRRSQEARAAALLPELAAGRWQLSAEQAEHFIDRLRQVAPRAAAGSQPPFTPFVTGLQLASVIERTSVPIDASPSDDVQQTSIHLGQRDYPFFSATVRANDGDTTEFAVGLVVDPTWARTAVLPDVSADAGILAAPLLVPKRRTLADSSGDPHSMVELGAAFAGWALVPSETVAAVATRRRDLLVFGGATTLVLGVLVLGVGLLIRDVGRQREMTTLRADFVSAVSHQLRTPLTLIRLYSEMLTDYPDTSENERRDRLSVITSESQRLTTLIDRVLDFSRVERGQRPYALEPRDLAAAVKSVADVYAQYLRRRGFTVDVQIDDEAPTVRFDAAAVGDAVVNLMDNASKYAGDGRQVLVRVACRGPDAVMVEVVDNGEGIPEPDRGRLFEPFYRGSNGKEKGGYGLGLFLVRHLMEAHAGSVEVESEVGKGSVFRLVFPADGSARS